MKVIVSHHRYARFRSPFAHGMARLFDFGDALANRRTMRRTSRPASVADDWSAVGTDLRLALRAYAAFVREGEAREQGDSTCLTRNAR